MAQVARWNALCNLPGWNSSLLEPEGTYKNGQQAHRVTQIIKSAFCRQIFLLILEFYCASLALDQTLNCIDCEIHCNLNLKKTKLGHKTAKYKSIFFNITPYYMLLM